MTASVSSAAKKSAKASGKSQEIPDYIIAIGSSAGGIEALEQLIRHLPPDLNACYIVAQHLSPTHPSMLNDLINRYSALKAITIIRTQRLKTRTIYITPPNKDVEYADGKVRLLSTNKEKGANPSVNRLFRSLAEYAGEKAVGIILSGTGRDGADGLKTIVNAGGQAIVQDPDTASYDGMPRAAIYTLHNPTLLAPAEIGSYLTRLSMGIDNASQLTLPADATQRVINRISQQTGVNLQAFKPTTLERRIIRRMSLLNIKTIERYFDFVCQNMEEARHFTESLSVAVTEFFRDKEIFNSLIPLLKQITDRKQGKDEPLRLWVIGCATGQEAYSLAILLNEASVALNIKPNFQIFATDMSEKLIIEARRALYSQASVADIDADLMEKYFEQRADFYIVSKKIRDSIYFSTHNIIKDPPFSRIDFVSCRNVLIYLQNDAKRVALGNMFQSMYEDAFLFLGNNEALGTEQSWFTPAQGDLRVYKKNPNAQIVPQKNALRLPQISVNLDKKISESPLPIEHQLSEVICQHVINPILLVDDQNQIIYTLGEVQEILDISGGPFDRSLNRLVKAEYRQVINIIINQLRKGGQETLKKSIIHHDFNNATLVTGRIFDVKRSNWILLELKAASLDGASQLNSLDESEKKILSTMESELSLTRESLQLVIQELESTNQELQNSNEELQTTNQELLSSNEELVATNEELHSTNEELITVNEELENKTYQLHNTSNDLENLQTSIELPLIVVGKDLRVKRYVNAVYNLLTDEQIQEGDLVAALDWKTPIANLNNEAKDVIKTGKRFREPIPMGSSYYQLYITPYLDEKKYCQGAIIFFTDITQLTRTQKALKKEQELAHITLESISDGVIRLNNNLQVDYINPAAETLCGIRESDVLNNKITGIIRILSEDTHKPIEGIFSQEKYQAKPEIAILITRSNQQSTIEYISTSITDEENKHIGYLFVMRDVSERQAALKRVIWQSSHDHLTGLVNRQEMENRLDKGLVSAQSNNITSTFMFIDLDQFKIVNDTCGHLAGDELLRRISAQILEELRSRDTLARLGGDEFGILLENCPLENAHPIACKVRDKISKYRFFWDEKLFKVGCCIGIVPINKETHSVSQLMRDADSACYAAKSDGGNSIQIHIDSDEKLNQQREQMSIITDINDALENQRFRLYYQPIYSAATGSISHWEVLVRMINRRHEFLLPQQFLPASERFGFIRQIDQWVITNAFKDLADLHNLTEKRPKLAINLSASSIADLTFRENLVNILQDSPHLKEQFIFEITETSAISNIDSANTFISQLRQFGCQLALDDFGTGVSTYSYLKRIDVDMIKIDGEFIQDIMDNGINQEIVKSIAHIAKLMNISTTAELVTSEECANYLHEIGVEFLQGDYLGRPIPADEFVSAVLCEDKKQPSELVANLPD